jgi:hypothetical protein
MSYLVYLLFLLAGTCAFLTLKRWHKRISKISKGMTEAQKKGEEYQHEEYW